MTGSIDVVTKMTIAGPVFGLVLLVGACSSSTKAKADAFVPATLDGGGDGLKVVKEFFCYEKAVAATQPIAAVRGLSGAELAIRPTDKPCVFDLLFVADGKSEVLSSSPSGYLLAGAGVTPSGETVVCASNVVHAPYNDAGGHAILGVRLECAVKRDGAWGAMTTLVDGGESWAPWIADIQATPDKPGVFKAIYKRDFTFQFLNLTDDGRPKTDGLYEVAFTRGDDGRIEPGAITKLSDKTNGKAKVTQEPWNPTAKELEELAPYVKRDKGRCPPPKGCPAP